MSTRPKDNSPRTTPTWQLPGDNSTGGQISLRSLTMFAVLKKYELSLQELSWGSCPQGELSLCFHFNPFYEYYCRFVNITHTLSDSDSDSDSDCKDSGLGLLDSDSDSETRTRTQTQRPGLDYNTARTFDLMTLKLNHACCKAYTEWR